VAALLAVMLLAPACGRRGRAPRTPPPPDYLKLGDGYFAAADYPNAIRSYQTFLQNQPAAPDADRAIFRQALSYSAVQDVPKAIELLQQLVTRYPDSAYSPPATLALRLHDEITRLKADLTKRDERVKELAKELEKLKQIDMERRPVRVPK
jgi:tetratricopeptide (TPR) repeat protein